MKRSTEKKRPDFNSMQKAYKGKRIFIAGGTGSIGSELVYQLLPFQPREIRVFSRDEHKQFNFGNKLRSQKNVSFVLGDIRDKDHLRTAMTGIDIAINAAALKHVPSSEFNPFEAIKTNVYGTQNLIEVALEKKVKRMITISTDKATNPAGTMGASKLLAEKLMSAAQSKHHNKDTVFCSVRFGNVLGSRGSMLNIFKDQVQKGGPVSITDRRMTRFIMMIPEAAYLVLKACSLAQGGEIFILKMPSVKLVNLVSGTIDYFSHKFNKSNKIKTKIIGMRPGERLHETLLTEEEVPYTYESKDMFIVFPSLVKYDKYNIAKYGSHVSRLRQKKTYCSNKVRLIKKPEIVRKLKYYETELSRRDPDNYWLR